MTCIYVDDKDAAYLLSWVIDSGSTFVNNEADCGAVLAVNDIIKDTDFTIYPNPVNTYFRIQSNLEIEKVKVYDVFGKLHRAYDKQDDYSVSNLLTGVYLIQLMTKSGVQTSKLVIE